MVSQHSFNYISVLICLKAITLILCTVCSQLLPITAGLLILFLEKFQPILLSLVCDSHRTTF